MTVTGVRRKSVAAWTVTVSVAAMGLGGCSGGMPDIHSISSINLFNSSTAQAAKPKADQPPSAAEIAQPGALADIALGKGTAPVTIVQYVSLNCAGCGAFQSETLPKVKKAYIDKGKVRLIVREFPEDGASTAAAAAARCVPAKDYLKAVEKFMAHQKDWTGPEVKKDAIYKLVKFSGLKRDKFDACLANQSMNEGLVLVKERGKGYGVTASPTFFVNGKKVAGAVSFEEMQGVIEAALASPPPSQPQAQQPVPQKAAPKST